jgi:diguanylate cyclase (GGDEF)-like protein
MPATAALPVAPADCREADGANAIAALLSLGTVSTVFQPIVELRSGELLGYEALARGPEGSALHAPLKLFEAARSAGSDSALDRLCLTRALEGFVAQQLPGRLFVNLRPQTLIDAAVQTPDWPSQLRKLGVDPSRIVLELTEQDPLLDFGGMREILAQWRAAGFTVAIDDLGEGFAGLRLWSELRPDWVKLDQHFTRGINVDPLKLEFVRAIEGIAHVCGSRVIAEGIETMAEYQVLRDLGVEFGQGYYIARPAAAPMRSAPTAVTEASRAARIVVYPQRTARADPRLSAGTFALYIEPVAPHVTNDEVLRRFEAEPECAALPVVTVEGRPLGIINRPSLIDRFARQYGRELFARKPCTTFMDADLMLADVGTPLNELSQLLVDSTARQLADGFIVTAEGRYRGMATAQAVMREATQQQLRAERYANPLTLLPGNVPIAEHTERLLEAGVPFAICYADLDQFKPFNDVMGYRRGDQVLLLLADALRAISDPAQDFLGHLGGDDFIVLFQSVDWEARCRRALSDFSHAVLNLIDPAIVAAGGYTCEDRRGEPVFHPLVSLSIGAVWAEAGQYRSQLDLSEAAAEAKRHAKRMGGGGLFVERRRPGSSG